ncbi:hypothetical protein [Nonomuraea recticatena]
MKRDLDELAAAVPALRPHPEVAAVRSVHRIADRAAHGVATSAGSVHLVP